MDLMKAVNAGYSAEQVLEFLVSSFPYLGKRLRQARQIGHDARSIINSFQGVSKEKLKELDDNARSSRDINFNPIVQGQEATSRSSARGQIDETASNLKNIGLATGGALLAGGALKNAIPPIAEAISQRGMPKIPAIKHYDYPKHPALKYKEELPNIFELAAQNPQRGSNVETQEMGATMAPGATQILPQTGQESFVDTKSSQEIIKEMGLDKKIQNLLEANNSPEVISSAIKTMMSPGQKTWLKSQTNQPIEEIVNDYLQTRTPEEEKKEKLVALPDGKVGTLIDERQGIGSVELPDGKVARRKLADMDEEPPELEKQITDLIASIPEDERSAVLAYASYTPDAEFDIDGKNVKSSFMGVQFHNGDFYMYPGVTKSQFDKVVSKAVKAKTTGENLWHAWTAGKESRGAGMHQLIQELEKEFGKNFIKFKASEGYDYFKRIREVVKKIEREKRRKNIT